MHTPGERGQETRGLAFQQVHSGCPGSHTRVPIWKCLEALVIITCHGYFLQEVLALFHPQGCGVTLASTGCGRTCHSEQNSHGSHRRGQGSVRVWPTPGGRPQEPNPAALGFPSLSVGLLLESPVFKHRMSLHYKISHFRKTSYDNISMNKKLVEKNLKYYSTCNTDHFPSSTPRYTKVFAFISGT
ncbi:unnamed protein product [Rangifer tarandus platyrhynchus]|uniref:Uncharacterized protein n=2 Tax=Rangifer tarandus platyrhynchus TaxID=3082113 RepID=A0ABN8ZXK6_RANTA|nr:unnamed protein product [Rangifer tarandus platyrhynchus]